MPTTAQAYLAIDTLSAHSRGELALAPNTVQRCHNVIDDCLSTPGWTGKVDGQCDPYGKPPEVFDPVTAVKVRVLDQLISMMFLDVGEHGLEVMNINKYPTADSIDATTFDAIKQMLADFITPTESPIHGSPDETPR